MAPSRYPPPAAATDLSPAIPYSPAGATQSYARLDNPPAFPPPNTNNLDSNPYSPVHPDVPPVAEERPGVLVDPDLSPDPRHNYYLEDDSADILDVGDEFPSGRAGGAKPTVQRSSTGTTHAKLINVAGSGEQGTRAGGGGLTDSSTGLLSASAIAKSAGRNPAVAKGKKMPLSHRIAAKQEERKAGELELEQPGAALPPPPGGSDWIDQLLQRVV